MPKVYIAAAFRRHSQRAAANRAYGEVASEEYITFLEAIEDVFLDFGFDTCLPHRDEGLWGKIYYEPTEISALCIRHVHTSDLLFAIAEGGRGVHIEIGYAAAFPDKRLLMVYQEETEPSTLIWGLLNRSPGDSFEASDFTHRATILSYKSGENLLASLRTFLTEVYGAPKPSVDSYRRTTAFVDIGSHTVKLKILRFRKGGHPQLIHSDKRSLGIIEHVLETGFLAKSSVEAILDTLNAWVSVARSYSTDRITVLATAALRQAQNRDEFLDLVRKQLGLEIEIIAPKRELELIFRGVQSTFTDDFRLAILNLGGGSTQIGVGAGKQLDDFYLLDFGTREIVAQWPWEEGFSAEDYNAMERWVFEKVGAVISGGKNRTPPSALVHTGGELDFLLRCRVPLTISHRSPVHVSRISVSEFRAFSRQFSSRPRAEVVEKFGLDPAWAVGSVASNLIASAVARHLGVSILIPSNLNIADGLVR